VDWMGPCVLDVPVDPGCRRHSLERAEQVGDRQGMQDGEDGRLRPFEQRSVGTDIARDDLQAALAAAGRRLGRPAKKTLAALEAITDPDRLARMTVALFDVKSWDELLAVP
jgi:hypothetical protein